MFRNIALLTHFLRQRFFFWLSFLTPPLTAPINPQVFPFVVALIFAPRVETGLTEITTRIRRILQKIALLELSRLPPPGVWSQKRGDELFAETYRDRALPIKNNRGWKFLGGLSVTKRIQKLRCQITTKRRILSFSVQNRVGREA